MHYARELSKYIQVDIYGTCGSLRCPRSQSQACFDMLDEDYKFYLAFENSNCKDYITEKFFVNGLGYDTFHILICRYCTRAQLGTAADTNSNLPIFRETRYHLFMKYVCECIREILKHHLKISLGCCHNCQSVLHA